MFRRFGRIVPTAGRLASFSLCLFLFHPKVRISPFRAPSTYCFNFPLNTDNMIGEVLTQVIRIENNGEFVGYAYCFSENLIVSASLNLNNLKNYDKGIEFYIGDKKIKTTFKFLGVYENLVFIETSENVFPILPARPNTPIITHVHVIRKMNYISIIDGYYVTNDAGYGIVNGKGEINSLVLDRKGVVGIVTHIGKDSERGFLRMIKWKDIETLGKKMRNNDGKIPHAYLGISVRSSELNDGLFVMRVSSDSPLSKELKMGDLITTVNEHSVRSPEDLVRVINLVERNGALEVKGPEGEKRVINFII